MEPGRDGRVSPVTAALARLAATILQWSRASGKPLRPSGRGHRRSRSGNLVGVPLAGRALDRRDGRPEGEGGPIYYRAGALSP